MLMIVKKKEETIKTFVESKEIKADEKKYMLVALRIERKRSCIKTKARLH